MSNQAFNKWYNVKTFDEPEIEAIAKGTAFEAWKAAQAEMEAENAELKARIKAMEEQEPVAKINALLSLLITRRVRLVFTGDEDANDLRTV